MAFYTNYRFRKLGLDGLIDVIYSSFDHDLPSGMSAAQIRKYPSHYYNLNYTAHKHTPKGSFKPDQAVLTAILDSEDADHRHAVYIGDSPMKDIPMAQAVGVFDVLAEYGAAQSRSEYQLLREVTHWTDGDVAREKAIRDRYAAGGVTPSMIAYESFAEILPLFQE